MYHLPKVPNSFILYVALVILINFEVGENYSYQSDDDDRPSFWYKKYKNCGGKNQSPIDLSEQTASKDQISSPLEFQIPEVKKPTVTMFVDANAERVKVSEKVKVSGGPIKGTYIFHNMVIRCGTSKTSNVQGSNLYGSEHSFNGHRFAVEHQMIFFNDKYSSYDKAESQKDGLVIISTMIKIGDNSWDFEPIYNNLKKPDIWSDSSAPIPYKGFRSLLPVNLDTYFTYTGSLSHPPCSESVRYIIFTIPKTVSKKQFLKLGELPFQWGNARPIQPAHKRKIIYRTLTQFLSSGCYNYRATTGFWILPTFMFFVRT